MQRFEFAKEQLLKGCTQSLVVNQERSGGFGSSSFGHAVRYPPLAVQRRAAAGNESVNVWVMS